MVEPARRHLARRGCPERLWLVVPAYNEEARLGGTLEQYRDALGPDDRLVIVVKGSLDQNEELARAAADVDSRMTVLVDPGPVGKGGALIIGFGYVAEHADRDDVVAYTDADAAVTAPDIVRFSAATSPDELRLSSRVASTDDSVAATTSRPPNRRRHFQLPHPPTPRPAYCRHPVRGQGARCGAPAANPQSPRLHRFRLRPGFHDGGPQGRPSHHRGAGGLVGQGWEHRFAAPSNTGHVARAFEVTAKVQPGWHHYAPIPVPLNSNAGVEHARASRRSRTSRRRMTLRGSPG